MASDSAEIQRMLTKMDGFQVQIGDIRERLSAAEVHRQTQIEALTELKDKIKDMADEIDETAGSAKDAVKAAKEALEAAKAALEAAKATEGKVDALSNKLAIFERVAIKLDAWDPEKAQPRAMGRVEWGGIAAVVTAVLTGGTALAAQVVSVWNGHAPPPPPAPQPITLEAPAPAPAPAPDQGTSDDAGVDP